MKYLKNFRDFIKKSFAIVPFYLRGIVLFFIVVLIAVSINKYKDRKNHIEIEIQRMRDEARYIDLSEEYNSQETIEVNKIENTTNGTVKENLKAPKAPSITMGKKSASKEAVKEPLWRFEGDYFFGSANAPITIIEYSSYSCPNCIIFHSDTMNSLKADFIDTGKVRYVKRMIIQSNTLLAVMLPYCAPNINRFTLIEELYASVEKWISPSSQKKVLEEIALRNGFTRESFDACVKNSKLGQDLLAKQNREIKELKIFYTPTIFINNEKQSGAIPYDKLKEQLNRRLENLRKGNVE